MTEFLAPTMAVWTEEDGAEGAGALIPCDGPAEYVRRDLLPDQIDIYRAIKQSGAQKHSDIAKAIADLFAQ